METRGAPGELLFVIDGKPVDAVQVIEFLCAIPGLQHLPMAAFEKIARVVQPKQYAPSDLLAKLSSGVYFIWKGEIITNKSRKVMKRGDYGTEQDVQGAQSNDKVICLFLSPEYSNLMSTSSMWNLSELQRDVCATEKLMELEKLETDVFRGFSLSHLVTFGQMFGGQLVGQALAAATKSVNPFQLVHSLHSYFLRPGDTTTPVVYYVQRIQDGRSFANRFVRAVQNNRVIFTMSASFQRQENGIEHQLPMPTAPQPEEVPLEEEIHRSYFTDPRVSLSTRDKIASNLAKDRPLDVRLCGEVDLIRPEPRDSREMLWFRARGRLSEDQALHRCVAAYASDWIFLDCCLRPHGRTGGPDNIFNNGVEVKMLTLDHAMWFHKPIKADDWLLFTMHSPRASSARGFVSGHIYTQKGELVISATQEGLVRDRRVSAKL